MSFRALSWVDQAFLGKPGAKTCGIAATLMALAQFTDEDNLCWPRQTTLAQRSRQCERTVRSNLAWLEANGFIEREARSTPDGRRADLVRLLVGKYPMGTLSYPQPAKSAACATGKIGTDDVQILPVALIHETVMETVRSQSPEKPAKLRFEAPTLEEWTAYMREHYPWVPASDIFSSFEFYRSGDWTLGNGKKVKSWQRCAATSQGNFLARNPTAKRDYDRKAATAARAPQKLLEATPVSDGFPDDPAWSAHLEKELAAGRNRMQAWMSWRSRA